MSEEVFGTAYAEAYDIFYGEKDYSAECDALVDMFAAVGMDVERVLDLGCGTGSHAIPLAQRGYEVTGVDRSEEMLSRAVEKASAARVDVALELADITSYRSDCSYDAVLMMFAVLGYQETNDDVLAALRTVRHHLRPGGIFIADFWYGPAVLSQLPSARAAVRDLGPEDMLIRVAEPTLDVVRHLCHVDYQIVAVQGGRLVTRATERHTMRFFFPRELELYCSVAGLRLDRLVAFPDCDGTPDIADWNTLLVATTV
jgi:SAM-dependent methyltransferase